MGCGKIVPSRPGFLFNLCHSRALVDCLHEAFDVTICLRQPRCDLSFLNLCSWANFASLDPLCGARYICLHLFWYSIRSENTCELGNDSLFRGTCDKLGMNWSLGRYISSFTADIIWENVSEQGREPTTHMSLTLALNQTFAPLERYDRLSRPTPITTSLPLKGRAPMHLFVIVIIINATIMQLQMFYSFLQVPLLTVSMVSGIDLS